MSSSKIIIVDDEMSILRVLEIILKRWGYRVITSSFPQECVGLVQEHRPSVVITDYVMPAIDGIQIVKSVIRLGLGVQLVLMSGQIGSKRAGDAYAAGAIDFIAKPIDNLELKSVLERACEISNRWRRTLSI